MYRGFIGVRVLPAIVVYLEEEKGVAEYILRQRRSANYLTDQIHRTHICRKNDGSGHKLSDKASRQAEYISD